MNCTPSRIYPINSAKQLLTAPKYEHMKIALVSQEYPPETANGGIGTQVYMRAHGLTELGHQMFVISHGPDLSRHEYMDREVFVARIPGYNKCLDPYTDPALWLS